MNTDWLLEQWLIAIVGAVLFVLLVRAMLVTKASITWRRVALLGLVGIVFSTAVWVLNGAFVHPCRTLTLIASCRTDKDKLQAGINALSAANPDKHIRLVIFTTDTGNGTTCTNLSALSVEGGEPVILRSSTGGGASGDTLPNLMKAIETAEAPSLTAPWHSLLDMFAIRTWVFMFDPTISDWEILVASLSPGEVLTAFQDFRGDLFLYNVNAKGSAYRVSIALGEGLHANKKMGGMITSVDLRLAGGPMSTGHIDEVVDICLSVDRSSSFKECESSTEKHWILLRQVKLRRESDDPPTWRWFLPEDEDRPILLDLLSFGKSGEHDEDLRGHQLELGWHSLEVRMRLKSVNPSQELPPVVYFFQVKRAGPVFVIGEEKLANEAWPVSVVASTVVASTTSERSVADPLLQMIYFPTEKLSGRTKKPSGRFKGISLPPQIPSGLSKTGSCILTEYDDIALINACAEQARSLVLVEPSLAFLKKITERNLPQQISQRGAGILVIGPPPLEPADEPTIGNWLPAWPKQDAPKVHTLRDVVLIADCSGLAHIPIDDTVDSMLKTDAIRPIEFQQNIVKKIDEKLKNLPEVKQATIAKYSTGEKAVLRLEYAQDWRPAVQVQINPGCLKASKKEMENARELVEFASVEQRIHAFLSETTHEKHGPFAAFRPGDLHPGSVIVVFSTQAAQLFPPGNTPAKRSGGAVAPGKLREDWIATPPPPNLLKRLKDAGIRVLVVELPTSRIFAKEADTHSGGKSWSEQLIAWESQDLVKVIRPPSGTNEADCADRLISDIGLGPTAPKPELKRTGFGRSLDPRVPETILTVPLVFSPLLNKAPSAHVLVKADSASGLGVVDAPLIMERNDAGAPVVALGYSPFDPVAWASDLQSPKTSSESLQTVCGSPCDLDDWINIFTLHRSDQQSSALGVQRVLDIVEQASREAAASDQLRLLSASLTLTGDAVNFQFALPANTSSWKDPTLELSNPGNHCGSHATADTCPLSLLALDPLAGTVTYRFSTLKGLPLNRYSLAIYGTGGVLGHKVELPLWLNPRQNLTTDGAKFLNLLNSAGATRITGNPLPPAERSALAPVTLILLFATLFLLLVRPRHALSRFWRRRHAEVPPVSFDAEIVSERAGYLLAVYEASRRSGDPAWLRRFQAGDSLSRAISADLLAFTPLGSQMRLARRPPRVRLREIGESFDLIIGIDDAPAMCHPGDWHGYSRKRAALEALITVIATSVTQQGGRWTVVGLRSGEPLTKLSVGDPEDMTATLAVFFKAARDPRSLLSHNHLPGTAARLLISDFLSADLADYVDWIGGNGNGAILLTDPEQADELGIGRDAARGTIYDRSVWERGDAAELLHRQRLEARYTVEQSGARFAEVDVDASSFEVAEALYTTGILQMAKR